jgi:hypothetical protein
MRPPAAEGWRPSCDTAEWELSWPSASLHIMNLHAKENGPQESTGESAQCRIRPQPTASPSRPPLRGVSAKRLFRFAKVDRATLIKSGDAFVAAKRLWQIDARPAADELDFPPHLLFCFCA